MAQKTITVDKAQVDALIKRVEHALANGLSITGEDATLLLQMLHTLLTFNDHLQDKDVTIGKLRKLAGLVSSAEPGTRDADGKRKRTGTRKRKNTPGFGADTPPAKPSIEKHPLIDYTRGQSCPECLIGKLYKVDPATFVRITGQAPLVATRHVLERMRCNACGAYFTAELSQEHRDDGAVNQYFGFSARAMIVISKYLTGVPFFRQQSLQQLFGFPVSAAAQFEQCDVLAAACVPIVECLIQMAGGAEFFALDDTGNRILEEKGKMIPDRRSQKPKHRTGIYTSAVIAELELQRSVLLFKTNIGHAGEWLDEIIKHRPVGVVAPIIMSDALNRNAPSVIEEYHWSKCNCHARREFDTSYGMAQADWVIEQYANIWQHDTHCETQGLTPQQRLAWHREHSLPIMEAIRTQCQQWLDSGEIEANSAMGKACRYYENHYDGLIAFCRLAGAKIDNNEVERTIKMIIRGRKNSLFYKTQNGADVGDTLMSLLATAIHNGINVLHYLIAIQQNEYEAGRKPHLWLPWNYHENLQAEQPQPEPEAV